MSDDMIPASSPLAKRLLSERFNPRNGKDLSKGEALLWAASEEKLELVRLLIEEGVDINWTDPLTKETAAHAAAKSGRCNMLVLLHETGADLTKVDKEGFEPLHYTAFKEENEAMRLLLGSLGVCVDNRMRSGEDIYGATALHMAAVMDNLDGITMLVNEFGADIRCTEQQGDTPLHYACRDSFEATQLLVDLGSQHTWVGSHGKTPLHEAVENNATNIV